MSIFQKFSPDSMSPGAIKAFGWIVAAAVSIAHVQAVFMAHFSEATFIWMYPLLLAIPALLSTILLPGQLKRWYRWAAILGLSFSVYADVLPAVLIIGETYALHCAWVVERTSSFKDLFTFKSRRKPADEPVADPSGSRSSQKPKAATGQANNS